MSDSDSDDLCDLTSDVSSRLNKIGKKFWKHHPQTNEHEMEDSASEPVPTTSTSHENDLSGSHHSMVTRLNSLSHTVTRILSSIDKNPRVKMNGSGRTQVSATVNTRGIKRKRNAQRQTTNAPRQISTSPQIVDTLVLDDSIIEIPRQEAPVVNKPQVFNTVKLAENELNPIVTVNILWKSVEYIQFKVYKFQCLNCVCEYFANKANVDARLLYFTIADHHFDLNKHSYVSLRLTRLTIIDGGTLSAYYKAMLERQPLPDMRNMRSFMVQASDNDKFPVYCKKDDKMEYIMWQVANKKRIYVENFKLMFDGRVVKVNDTIEGLEIEENNCFDLVMC